MGDALRRSMCRVTPVSIDLARASSPSAACCPAQPRNVMNVEPCVIGLYFCRKSPVSLLVMSLQQPTGRHSMNTITTQSTFCLIGAIADGNVNSQADGIHGLC